VERKTKTKTIQHHKRGDEQTNYCNKNDHRLIIKKREKEIIIKKKREMEK